MITEEKVFFLNQLLDSVENAVESLETSPPKKQKEIVDFILSVQAEIKDLLLVIK
jgi:hypothetical protein